MTNEILNKNDKYHRLHRDLEWLESMHDSYLLDEPQIKLLACYSQHSGLRLFDLRAKQSALKINWITTTQNAFSHACFFDNVKLLPFEEVFSCNLHVNGTLSQTPTGGRYWFTGVGSTSYSLLTPTWF